MKTTFPFAILVLSFILLLTSCATNLYTPNEAYMLGLGEKGDVKVAGSFLANGDKESLNSDGLFRQSQIQFAFSPIKHLGIIGSHFRQRAAHFHPRGEDSRRQTELGLGYYNKSGKKEEKNLRYVLQDIYAGMGWGQYYELFPTAGEMHLEYQRYFLHYALQLSWRGGISISLGLRYAHTRYNTIHLIGKIPRSPDFGISDIGRRSPLNTLESSLRMQFGNKYIKPFFSFSSVLRMPSQISNQYLFGTPIYHLGIVFELDNIWKKTASKKKG